MLVGNTYLVYRDGRGDVAEGARDDGYCPVCNTKNFEKWQAKTTQQLADKAEQDRLAAGEVEERHKTAREDQARAAAQVETDTVSFTYSSGDNYQGEMINGQRSGFGKMSYGDGACYEGQWVSDLHEGQGTKWWEDGIEYVGAWKAGLMHGQGRYTMTDGYVMEGLFQNDEFVE